MSKNLPNNLSIEQAKLEIEQKNYAKFDHRQTLFAVAEQLKNPLSYIARQAELAGLGGVTEELTAIRNVADASLTLVDSLLLCLRLHDIKSDNLVEPVSLGAVMYDVAQLLSVFAKQNDCELRLESIVRQPPVLANQLALKSAMLNLGYEFISARAQAEEGKPIVTLATHKSRWGMVAGLYSDTLGINTSIFRKSKLLYGRASQPLPSLISGSGAGVFVADSLLHTMSSSLRVAYHHKQGGLAATLLPSQQLSII